MKKSAAPVEVVEVPNEGLISLLDKKVMVWCGVYIYTGVLEGVNETCIKLTDASVVYETGKLKDQPKHKEELPGALYLRTQAIECFYEAP